MVSGCGRSRWFSRSTADRVALVALLVTEGANVTKKDGGEQGNSLLYLACWHGLVGVVELLISQGVDINFGVCELDQSAL
jgi:ankyrin repeat protein